MTEKQNPIKPVEKDQKNNLIDEDLSKEDLLMKERLNEYLNKL